MEMPRCDKCTEESDYHGTGVYVTPIYTKNKVFTKHVEGTYECKCGNRWEYSYYLHDKEGTMKAAPLVTGIIAKN